MGAAADQVDAVQVLEAVARPQVQHLAEVVGEVERRAAVDLHVVLPVGGRDHLLEADALLQVVQPELAELSQHQLAVAPRARAASRCRVLVRHRHQDVERAVARRRQARVGDAGVLHVERRVSAARVPSSISRGCARSPRRGRSCGGRGRRRPSTPRYSMKVEQENRLRAICASVQRRRRRSGTRRVMAAAKSALITRRSQGYVAGSGAHADRAPVRNRISSTSSPSSIRTPRSRATRAIASITAPQPPSGCNTPYSYSRNDRIENRLGQLNGDMPRYLDWNEKPGGRAGRGSSARGRRRARQRPQQRRARRTGGASSARALGNGRSRTAGSARAWRGCRR